MGAFRRRWPGLSYGRGEDWHYVGATDEPAFQNSWANASGLPKLAFRLREAGVVDIQGTVKSGTAVTVFTLPEGYRPSSLAGGSASGYITGVGRVPVQVGITTAGAVGVFVNPDDSGDTYPTRVYFGALQVFLDPPDAA